MGHDGQLCKLCDQVSQCVGDFKKSIILSNFSGKVLSLKDPGELLELLHQENNWQLLVAVQFHIQDAADPG